MLARLAGRVALPLDGPLGPRNWAARTRDTRGLALASAAMNALPRLFAELDRLSRGVPVVVDVVKGGRVAWRGETPQSY